jgi:hypothetical protein
MDDNWIKNEMRLFALESIVCQQAATLFQMFPREFFDAAKQQAMTGTEGRVFPGFDPALSDHLSAEFQTALIRLYGMIQHHLDAVQSRGNSQSGQR